MCTLTFIKERKLKSCVYVVYIRIVVVGDMSRQGMDSRIQNQNE